RIEVITRRRTSRLDLRKEMGCYEPPGPEPKDYLLRIPEWLEDERSPEETATARAFRSRPLSPRTRRPVGCPSGSTGPERPRKAQDGQRRRFGWNGRAAVKRASPPKRTCPQAD